MRLERETGIGRLAGSEEMYIDFDMDEKNLRPEPPDMSDPSTDEVSLYRYYVQRILCSVPRAEALRGRMVGGTASLRTQL